MIEMIANKAMPNLRPHTTHSACALRLSVFGGKTIGCCCTGHDCTVDYYPLGLSVPGYGKIGSMKKGQLEREYLLTGGGVVTWLSHSDIKAMLEANHA